MIVDGLGFNDVRYNPELSAFEALVYIREGEDVFAYPVYMPAPLNAEFSVICEGLTEKAIRAHRDTASCDMRLHRTPAPQALPPITAPPKLHSPSAALAA